MMPSGNHDVRFVHAAGTLGLVALYSLLGSVLVPEGVNSLFLLNLWRLAAAVLCFVLLVRLAFRSTFWPKPDGQGRKDIIKADLLLLLLPMTPVLQYAVLNQDVLSTLDTLGLVIMAIAFLASICLLLPVLLSRYFSARMLMLASIALAYTFLSMASYSAQFEWHKAGDFKIQLPMFLLTMALLFLLHYSSRRTSYVLAAVFFVSSGIAGFFGDSEPVTENAGSADNGIEQRLAGVQFTKKPNVYYLTYESYADDAAHKHYGIDNGAQMNWLEAQGFEVHAGVYSLASASTTSISRVFAMDAWLEKPPRHYIAGDNPVRRVFKRNGYATYGIFSHDYLIQNVPVSYDRYFPQRSDPLLQLASAIGEGEFRFNVGYDEAQYDSYLSQKQSAIVDPVEPKFMYTHNRLPAHSQNSGRCRANEVSLYEQRLREANMEMTRDVETLLASDPGAIIILAGDHGPYLTKNCMYLERGSYPPEEIERADIQDRLGVLLAIRWPSWARHDQCDITVLQDTFVAVLAALAEDPSLLELTIDEPSISQGLDGVTVYNGRIRGGRHAGERLFDSACPARPPHK